MEFVAPLSLARSDENVGVLVPNELDRGLLSITGEECGDTAMAVATVVMAVEKDLTICCSLIIKISDQISVYCNSESEF